jgi:hypothetical protein
LGEIFESLILDKIDGEVNEGPVSESLGGREQEEMSF